MNVCLVMFYDDRIKKYGDVNYEINKKYCEKYRINLIHSSEKKLKKHSMWERIPLLLEHIKNHDYIIWIDADAYFYYDSDNICEEIMKYLDYDFIFSHDIRKNKKGVDINSGFFIVKNSEYSIDFLKKWLDDNQLHKNNPYPWWPDQGVLIYMYNKNIMNIQEKSVILNYGVLQHFRKEELNKLPNIPYVHHVPNRSTEVRYNISKKYLDEITKL
jgi:Nucleotide-diphospho-sugar transferase